MMICPKCGAYFDSIRRVVAVQGEDDPTPRPVTPKTFTTHPCGCEHVVAAD